MESDDEIKILYENWLYHKAKIIFKEKVKIKAFQKIAIVVCLENIDSVIEDENSIRMGVIATNIFEKQNVNNKNNYEWLMVHHHGYAVANYMAPNVSDLYLI